MPTYTFQHPSTGHYFEANVPMDQRPAWGEKASVEGPDGTQVYAERVMEGKACAGRATDERVMSRSLPKWDPAAKRFDKAGHPIFTSKAERTDFMKRRADQGRPIAWD